MTRQVWASKVLVQRLDGEWVQVCPVEGCPHPYPFAEFWDQHVAGCHRDVVFHWAAGGKPVYRYAKSRDSRSYHDLF